MILAFEKSHVCGNDFVMLWEPTEPVVASMPQLAKALCRRRTGVGADQLVAVIRADAGAFAVRIFNPDGSEAPMCGNALLAAANGLMPRGERKVDLLVGGRRRRAAADEAGRVWVELARPQVLGRGGARRLAARRQAYDTFPVLVAGAPHTVVFLTGLDRVDVASVGAALESQWVQEGSTNVMFVEVIGPGELRMRPWERAGTGETFACGSGSAAAAAVHRLIHAPGVRQVRVSCPGGVVEVRLSEAGEAEISAEAVVTFTGDLPWPPKSQEETRA